MKRFRYEYGAGPGHLIAGLAAVGIGVWALVTLLGLTGRPGNVVRWFVGSVVGHDLIALPLYSAAGLLVATLVLRRNPTPLRIALLNHLRVPGLLSAFAFLVWFPLILQKSPRGFERATGYAPDVYLGRWLWLTIALFAISALLFLVRLPRLRSTAE